METKTYRGRTLDEVLPRIKEELGPDAVITRQRNGLTGGVGGFFQRECIEVEARRAERRFDAYDEDPEPAAGDADAFVADEPDGFVADELTDEAATSEGLSSRAIQEMLEQAAPFAEHLSLAEKAGEPAPAEEQAPPQREFAPEPEEDEPAPPPRLPYARPSIPQHDLAVRAFEPPAEPPTKDVVRTAGAEALNSSLIAAGIKPALATEIVDDCVVHDLPFATPRSLKRLVRSGLARRIPTARPSGSSRTIAFAGPGGAGKTLCSARVAAAYAAAGSLQVTCVALRPADGGAELRALLEPLGIGVLVAATGAQARALIEPRGERSIVVIDTPALGAKSQQAIAELAGDLASLDAGEVHVTLPSTYSGPAARELIAALGSLGEARVALTHTDESSHVGALVDAIVETRTPVSYVTSGRDVGEGIEPADAETLAGWVLS